MKCRKCNSDVLQSFRFRHDCGNVLDEHLPNNESIVSVDGSISGHAAHSATGTRASYPVSNNSQPQPATRVLSFDEFRKQKPPKDVLTGIGIMALTKGELTKAR